MKIVVMGAGPSGLYFALLAKKSFPKAQVDVFEQNPKDATYGFGIVLADRGLHRFQAADSASYEAIMKASFMTRHRIVEHPSETIFLEGGGYGGAIARLRLLNILEGFCERSGVTIHYETRIDDPATFGAADLVVGADGVNSALRKSREEAFGVTRWTLTNRLAWYGTRQHFPYPLLSFKKAEGGHFVAAAYPYTEQMSTFVVECDANTWFSSGLDRMSEDEGRVLAERVYAKELGGQPLISNKSMWHCLPVVRVKQWYVGNCVLIGDALHSAHPSIGSGTRIAMEDSISLINALVNTGGDVATALPLFRRVREPQKQKLVLAAEKSFCWYESFAARVNLLEPVDFVFDFLTRTGRIDAERLTAEYPRFMQKYADRWVRTDRKPPMSGSPPDAPLAGCAERVIARTPVQIRHRVRWGDCDPAGVVYTPRFSDYIVTGFRDFLEILLDGPLSKRLIELDVGTPAKALSLEFKRSLWPDQEFVMTIRVGDIRTRTFDLDFQAVDVEGNDVFVARFTAICVYAAVREARPIPDELRQRLEQYRLQCSTQIPV